MYLRALVEGREGPGGKTLTIVNDFGFFCTVVAKSQRISLKCISWPW